MLALPPAAAAATAARLAAMACAALALAMDASSAAEEGSDTDSGRPADVPAPPEAAGSTRGRLPPGLVAVPRCSGASGAGDTAARARGGGGGTRRGAGAGGTEGTDALRVAPTPVGLAGGHGMTVPVCFTCAGGEPVAQRVRMGTGSFESPA